nr:hypothetical protein [Escherichia coli]
MLPVVDVFRYVSTSGVIRTGIMAAFRDPLNHLLKGDALTVMNDNGTTGNGFAGVFIHDRTGIDPLS